MLSSSLTLSTILLSLCFVVVLSLPLSKDHGLSTSRYLSSSNLRSIREKRVRLPVGRSIATLRRKREAVEEDSESDNVDNINESIDDDEETDQLDELNDEELAILARIVQDELDRYNPDVTTADEYEYQIVKLPRSLGAHPVSQYIEDIGDNGNELTVFPDDQPEIVRPVIELPDDEIYEMNTGEQMEEIPEYVLIPESEVMEVSPVTVVEEDVLPIDEDTLDDLELRTRIAVLADALNERATRGL